MSDPAADCKDKWRAGWVEMGRVWKVPRPRKTMLQLYGAIKTPAIKRVSSPGRLQYSKQLKAEGGRWKELRMLNDKAR
ncbi:hypothetical protein THAOC_13215 [Thalassiosira oceanica]|uniref:Uncharacterized protein n=1 Tax=Thalassiosira oceanica TaxID=159749 RepID=K0SKN2_THAOC|nr:hypothetical protein THAOC_13215 [Thalassiosira oceanica]|eukprot:EJK65885.1 hypothetical protein THAOC_13215 [Thalassiosira oceanica]